jgi:hypothetical protein
MAGIGLGLFIVAIVFWVALYFLVRLIGAILRATTRNRTP